MSFIKSMQQRYTTKVYNASKKVSSEDIEKLKEILRLSPSSINSQPWKFTFVRDETVKRQLSEVSQHNKDKVLNCDFLIIFSRVEDIDFFEQQIERELPEFAINYFRKFIKPKPEIEVKSWFDKQVYLSLGILLSACASMKIDATPMEGIEPEKYDEILALKNYKTLVAVAVGYRDEADFNQPSKKPKLRRKIEDVIDII